METIFNIQLKYNKYNKILYLLYWFLMLELLIFDIRSCVDVIFIIGFNFIGNVLPVNCIIKWQKLNIIILPNIKGLNFEGVKLFKIRPNKPPDNIHEILFPIGLDAKLLNDLVVKNIDKIQAACKLLLLLDNLIKFSVICCIIFVSCCLHYIYSFLISMETSK